MDSSPLHTHLLRNRPRSKRCICSSDKDTGAGRTSEIQDSSPHIHSDCSPVSCVNIGSSPHPELHKDEPETEMTIQADQEVIIIQQVHMDTSPWQSDIDSDTSTPSYKRGRHSVKAVPVSEPLSSPNILESLDDEFFPEIQEEGDLPVGGDTTNELSVNQEEAEVSLSGNDHVPEEDTDVGPLLALEKQAREEIIRDGINLKLPTWLEGRGSKRSVFVMADAQFASWPRDNICWLEYHPGWSIRKWVDAIRSGSVLIPQCYTVIMYLEDTQKWEDVPPVKNALQSLCKTVRNYSNGWDPRIFIANHLPQISSSPLKNRVDRSNFILQQATRSIGRTLGRIFELSLYEHFVSQKGKLVRPTSQYFSTDQLTYLGCLTVRECMFREAGMKTYWFNKSVAKKK